LELAGLVGDRVEHVLREPDLFADLDQHPAEVDDDLSVGGRDVVSDIVFEDRQNGPVGCPVGVLPDGPQRRAVEQRFGGVDERIAQYPCQRTTETLELFGKLLIDRRTDIDVLVERVDQPDRHLPTHVVVVEQLRARVHPGVGVEELALDPRVQCAQHHHDRAEDDQQPHHGAMRRLPFDLVGRNGDISRGSVIHAHSSSSFGWCFQTGAGRVGGTLGARGPTPETLAVASNLERHPRLVDRPRRVRRGRGRLEPFRPQSSGATTTLTSLTPA
jgi:hypothetical protein